MLSTNIVLLTVHRSIGADTSIHFRQFPTRRTQRGRYVPLNTEQLCFTRKTRYREGPRNKLCWWHLYGAPGVSGRIQMKSRCQLEIATSFFNFFTIILIIQQLFPVCGSFFCSFHVLYRIVLFLFYFIHNTVYFYICFFKLILVTVSLAALCAESPTLINKHIFITS